MVLVNPFLRQLELPLVIFHLTKFANFQRLLLANVRMDFGMIAGHKVFSQRGCSLVPIRDVQLQTEIVTYGNPLAKDDSIPDKPRAKQGECYEKDYQSEGNDLPYLFTFI